MKIAARDVPAVACFEPPTAIEGSRGALGIPAESPDKVRVGGFGAYSESHPDAFSVLFAPADAESAKSCKPIEVMIAFTAPEEPGLVEGTLVWEVTTEKPDGTYHGEVATPLLGRTSSP